MVCTGTARFVDEGAATVPGTAAAVYEGVKMDKYSDQPETVSKNSSPAKALILSPPVSTMKGTKLL